MKFYQDYLINISIMTTMTTMTSTNLDNLTTKNDNTPTPVRCIPDITRWPSPSEKAKKDRECDTPMPVGCVPDIATYRSPSEKAKRDREFAERMHKFDDIAVIQERTVDDPDGFTFQLEWGLE